MRSLFARVSRVIFVHCLVVALMAGTILGGHAVAGGSDPGQATSVPARRDASPQKSEPIRKPPPKVRFHTKPKPLSGRAVTNDWPRFLGPTHNLVSTETGLLKHWPEGGPTLVWEMTTGSGYAAPAIVGDRLIYFHRVGDEETVECLHPQTGESYWAFRYLTSYKDRYEFSDGPRASPVIDDGRVYTYGAAGVLHCLDLQTGKVIWKRDILAEFKVPQNFFGVGSTPLVEGDLLIVNVGAPGGPCVAAFDKRTGKTVWKAGDRWGAGYASPVPALVHGRQRVFVFAGGDSRPPTGGLLSIDPASGTIDFRFPFRSRRYESINAASPVVVGHQVFLSSSYRTGCVLVNVLSDGGCDVAWKSEGLRTHFATPVHREGYLYGFDGSGKGDTALVCVELKTGEQKWRALPTWDEKIERNGKKQNVTFGIFRGSLVFADGHFLCLGEMGHLLWLDLTPKGYKELSQARLFLAEESWTLPVISRGLLYVTQNTRDTIQNTPPRLLCYDLRATK